MPVSDLCGGLRWTRPGPAPPAPAVGAARFPGGAGLGREAGWGAALSPPAPASLAVVYHHGSSATGGHYTTDVFQIGLNGWLRIDDQTVKVINQYQVVKPAAERTAYLLYYRRVDLL